MGLLNHNSGSKIDWGFNTEGFEFIKAAELKLGQKYAIHGAFTTPDNGYGVGAVIILDDALMNVPASQLEKVTGVLDDPEAVADIKTGKYGIVISEYTSKKFKRKGLAIEFVEM